jgi:RimJ/RimL family protein N-acetyltransferase
VIGMKVSPRVLEGEIVRLEPLAASHVEDLARVGLDPSLWQLQLRPVRSVSDMRAYVKLALEDQRLGRSLPFAIVDQAGQMVIGSTRFMDVAPEHRRLEIGATWLSPAYQRTGANVEAKLLMLEYAFDVAGAQKVVFKTEALNDQSRRAILALGAIQEGVLRRHLTSDDGRRRDMAYFSILDEEWPAVRERNEARLARRRKT